MLVGLGVVSDTRTGAGGEGIRAIMRRALSLYRSRFRLYVALVAIPVIPVGIALAALAGASPDPAGQQQKILGIDLAAELLLVMPICTAFVAYAVVGQIAGRAMTLSETLRAVLPRSSILVGTVILSAIATCLGLVALVLPFFVMLIWFQFVGQVVILEHASYLDALRRCRALVRGAWWRTFGWVLAINLVSGVAGVLLSAIVSGALQPQNASERSKLVVPLIANIPSSILVLPFSTIALTLVYLRLRDRTPAP
ncbi:MAG: hypothetical protein QOH15_3314 [Gaiellales bacterium]|nr:hypothetical protein [Gaiellales bacterium]